MKFDQLVVLLPCHSLEDLSLTRPPQEAEQLLGAWSALFHPALLASARDLPRWLPASEPPTDPAGLLVILPDCSVEPLPEGWLNETEEGGACVIRGLQRRDQMVAAALEKLGGTASLAAGGTADRISPDLVADFLALGFCHFLVELLTRQLRYMSNLDEESFRTELLAAAEAAVGGDEEAARQRLQAAFDLLHEAREYFYPVESHLLDLTLVAPTTLGEKLRAELATAVPSNLLISGEVVREMARREPATMQALIDALKNDTAAIIGGEFTEPELSLLSPEAIRHRLLDGLDAYQEHLDSRPTIFGRRRFGLAPVLPQILRQLAFTGAIHVTLDEGRFPVGNQSRLQWEGIDGTTIEALGRVPVDVGRASAFLRLPEKLGDSMDLDHVATIVLAHWPGQSSPWYEDVIRIAGYCSVLGSFSTIDAYFDETGMTGQQTRYRPDQYRSPYLQQAVAAGRGDPISRWVRYFSRRAAVENAQALQALSTLVSGVPDSAAGGLARQLENSLTAETDPGKELNTRLQAELDRAAHRFADSVTRSGGRSEEGHLIVNPYSFSRRLYLQTPESAQAADVAGSGRAADNKTVMVDVPSMGFAWVGPGFDAERPVQEAAKKKRRRRKQKEEPPLAEENLLRNEFFEVTVDPHTGALRSISDYHTRGARLAQQVALRTPQPGSDEPGDDANYSIMVADELTVTSAGPILGEIVCRGRLVDRKVRRLAGFTQTTRVRRGSRVIELQIDLDVDEAPGANPWSSYYAARFAWGDATADVYRSVNLANVPTDAVQLESPHFVDIRAGKARTTLLCGGLPYHRLLGLRKLDTLLVVRGEAARSFRLGIGIDVSHPIHAALDFLSPPAIVSSASPPTVGSSWLFHLDARNVIATSWEPLTCDGSIDGFRVRLLETDGRKVRLGLRSFRPIESAGKIKPGDGPSDELPVAGDQVTVAMGPHEWAEVEARFA